MSGWMYAWMDGRMDVCMYVWMDGCMDGWMDVWMDGWMSSFTIGNDETPVVVK